MKVQILTDGISAAAGSSRPGAQDVSNKIVARDDQDLLNARDLSAFVYAWSQFLDRDIEFTDSASPKESLPISVPTGDVYFDPTGTGLKTIGLIRSKYDLASLNIQLGRDHGLADYNTVRVAYGLSPVTSFAQITSDHLDLPADEAQCVKQSSLEKQTFL